MSEVLHYEYGYVYGIKSLHLIKVGVASNIPKRMNAMRLDNPHGCELVFYRRVYAPYMFEKKMHELLADKAVGREWFRVSVEDVRNAALKARLASIKAKRRADRPLTDKQIRKLERQYVRPELSQLEINIRNFNDL